MSDKHMKIVPKLLSHWEIQTKTTMRNHYTFTGTPIWKETDSTKC